MYLDAQELNSKLLDYAASVSAASISVATPSLSTLGLELGMETRSLAKDLKQATAEAHNIVERHPGIDLLITGLIREHFSVDPLREELTLGFCTAKELHTRYLICLYHVYSTLEAALDQQASHPALAAVYNPATLARASKLEDDIRYFLALQPGQDWKEHPQARISHWPREIQIALGDYVDRIQVLTAALPNDQQDKQLWAYPPPSASIDLLLSHAYVRYMGDMSGGQEIRKSIAAAYSLPLDLPDGQRFYEFGPKGCDGKEIRQIKRDFREGLDRAGQELSPQAYENVLQEANHTFELNIRLFSSFASSLPVDMSSAPPPHSHPVLSTQSSPSSPGGKCPFRNLKFAANASHTATLDLVKHKSLLTSLQTPLVAILVLLLAFVAHQLITNLS